MHGGWSVEFVKDRNARLLDEAGERRLARLVPGGERASMRARAARQLFGFAVDLEREETWRVVWGGLETPRET